MRHRRVPAPLSTSGFAGFRFPPEVITVVVRWYLRYGLSYRDVAELLESRTSRSPCVGTTRPHGSEEALGAAMRPSYPTITGT